MRNRELPPRIALSCRRRRSLDYDERMDTLRVLSLNIWNRSGPWDARLPLIRAGLAAEAAHLVGLQEVMCIDGPLGRISQLDELAPPDDAAAHYPHRVYAPAWTIDSGSGFTMGNALLSQLPIVDSQQGLLPNPMGHETRSLLFALCQTPHGLQPVAVTHLDWQLHLSHVRLPAGVVHRRQAGRVAGPAPPSGR